MTKNTSARAMIRVTSIWAPLIRSSRVKSKSPGPEVPRAAVTGFWANCRLAIWIWSPRVWSKPTADCTSALI